MQKGEGDDGVALFAGRADSCKPRGHSGLARPEGLHHGAQAGFATMVDGRQERAADQVARLPVTDPVGLLRGIAAHGIVRTGYGGETDVHLAQDRVRPFCFRV